MIELTPEQLTLFLSKIRFGRHWIWKAGLSHNGYGIFSVGRSPKRAHVIAYNIFVGEIPAGLEPDHLCRLRNCVRPNCIEPVTHAENMARIAGPRFKMCKSGLHRMSGNNVYRWTKPNGLEKRQCRKCIALRRRG